MEVGAFLGDALTGIRSAAQSRDGFALDYGLSDGEVFADFLEVGVERPDGNALDLVLDDDIDAVIGEASILVDVGDAAVCGGGDGVGGFAFCIAFRVADIDALVHLPAAGSRAAELSMGPGFAHGFHVEEFPFAGVKEVAVWRGEREYGCVGGCCSG